MLAGEKITSLNGKFEAGLSHDGNLIISAISQYGLEILWSSKTWKSWQPFAILQADGNFVIYSYNDKPIWASNTHRRGRSPQRVVMQNDGNLVILDSDNRLAWSSYTFRF
jgi:hypothetical protein